MERCGIVYCSRFFVTSRPIRIFMSFIPTVQHSSREGDLSEHYYITAIWQLNFIYFRCVSIVLLNKTKFVSIDDLSVKRFKVPM